MAPARNTIQPSAARGLDGLFERYGLVAGSSCERQMQGYLALLEKWNAKINLTASSSWEILGPLFEEAIWSAQFYPRNATLHLDVGSGAGFPGLILRLLRPEMHLVLIESRSRRCAFLETVVSELNLDRTRVINARLDKFLRDESSHQGWDVVSWKAVRLSNRDLDSVAHHCGSGSQLWTYHSKSLPVDDPAQMESSFELLVREQCPAREGWFLSIYQKRIPQ